MTNFPLVACFWMFANFAPCAGAINVLLWKGYIRQNVSEDTVSCYYTCWRVQTYVVFVRYSLTTRSPKLHIRASCSWFAITWESAPKMLDILRRSFAAMSSFWPLTFVGLRSATVSPNVWVSGTVSRTLVLGSRLDFVRSPKPLTRVDWRE